jgi:hypothetical protein
MLCLRSLPLAGARLESIAARAPTQRCRPRPDGTLPQLLRTMMRSTTDTRADSWTCRLRLIVGTPSEGGAVGPRAAHGGHQTLAVGPMRKRPSDPILIVMNYPLNTSKVVLVAAGRRESGASGGPLIRRYRLARLRRGAGGGARLTGASGKPV